MAPGLGVVWQAGNVAQYLWQHRQCLWWMTVIKVVVEVNQRRQVKYVPIHFSTWSTFGVLQTWHPISVDQMNVM